MNKLLVVLVLVGMLCFFQADARTSKMRAALCIKKAKNEFVDNGPCAALELLADCLKNDDLYATISAALPFDC